MSPSAHRTATTTAALVALLLAALTLSACGGGSKKSESVGDNGTTDVAGKSSVDLELDDNYFKPQTVNGKPGQKLTIELENEGSAEHNFTIDDQSVSQDVEGGKSASVTVTLPRSGTVAFYCKYHKSAGMTGTLAAGGASGAGAGGGTSTGDDMMGGTSTKDDSGGIGY